MGVWERSPAGLALANGNAELQASFRSALPDLRPEDVVGSPYCVRGYVVDADFGGPTALAAARAALAARGARLVLDYVPNHVSRPSLGQERPGTVRPRPRARLGADPAGWLKAAGQVLAHGRDPYFRRGPMSFSSTRSPRPCAPRPRTLAESRASVTDPVRHGHADDQPIFAKTWGTRAGPAPAEEFWPAVLGHLRAQHPETVLVAEAYWDMEWELQQQGFDFCYDKRLYDRIIEGGRVRRPRPPPSRSGIPVLAAALPGEPRRAPRRVADEIRAWPSGPPPSASRPCPVPRCGTRASSRACGCGCRFPGPAP